MRSRKRYLAGWERMLTVRARNAERVLKSYFNNIARKVSKAYKEGGKADAEQALEQAILGLDEILEKEITKSARASVKFTSKNMPEKKFDFVSFMSAWIQAEALKKSVIVTGTTRKLYGKVIDSGIELGESNEDIAKRLINGGLEMSVYRSAMIARTEVHNSASFAQEKLAEAFGDEIIKEWVSASDSRTRRDHERADGQRVKNGELFDVGGERISRPSDGSAGNAINCRCTMLLLTQDEINNE